MRNRKKVYFAITPCSMYPYIIPYTWGLLRAYAEQESAIKDEYEFVDPFYYGVMMSAESILNRIKIDEPFILACSCFIWNFNLHMKICRIVKERFPKCVTLIGGPYIPHKYLNEGFFEKHPYIDLVGHGNGEIIFRDILLELLKDKPELDNVKNISINDKGHALYTGKPTVKLHKTLNKENFPSPYLNGYFDDIVYRMKMNISESKKIRGMITGLIETQRGCGHNCIYCSWPNQDIHKIDDNRVYEELEYLASLDIQSILLADSNYGLSRRDVEIAKKIVEIHDRTGKLSHVATTFSKRYDISLEIGKILSKLGNDNNILLKGINLPIQSTSENVLEAVNRKNYSFDEFRNKHELFDKENIPTLTDMMLPLPEETRGSFMKGMCDLLEVAPETQIRLFLWLLTPDSRAYEHDYREKYGLEYIERDQFSRGLYKVPADEHPTGLYVVQTRTMTKKDWVDCKVFHEIVIAVLHNGAYTKFLSVYLNESGINSFHGFYIDLYEYFSEKPSTLIGSIITKNKLMAGKFITNEEETEFVQPMFQDDLKSFLFKFKNMAVYGNNSDWAWLKISERIDDFYGEIKEYLISKGIDVNDPAMNDLFDFQKDIMLALDYDPSKCKSKVYNYNWPGYFNRKSGLNGVKTEVTFTDQNMGSMGEDRLVAGSHYDFSKAAVGNIGYEGIIRRYHHQFDMMKVKEFTREL
jgi:putative methyltransferase